MTLHVPMSTTWWGRMQTRRAKGCACGKSPPWLASGNRDGRSKTEPTSWPERWLTQTRVARAGLSDRKQAVYDDIQATSTKPQRISLGRPTVRQEETQVRDKQGNKTPLPTRTMHLLADSNGEFPINLNGWEITVLDTEMSRPRFLAWYRNPSRAGKESFTVSYVRGRA